MSIAIRRNTKRKGCDCPFRLLIVPKEGRKYWVVKTIEGRGFHNHALMVYPEGHRQVSKLSPAAKKVVEEMSASHVKPRHIMKAVRGAFPDIRPNMRHLYNARHQIRASRQEGRNPVQQFLHQAIDLGYTFYVEYDSMGSMTRSFIAHPSSIKLLHTYYHVIHIDATYKTNKHKYPLVELVGVTPTNKNFLIAWVLLKSEDSHSYRWVLETLKNLLGSCRTPNAIVSDRDLALIKYMGLVFPNTAHLLCTWHINHDVESWVTRKTHSKKAGTHFGQGAWKRLLNSTTEEQYDMNYFNLIEEWGYVGENGPGMSLTDYINGAWLKYKESFVKCWTDQVTHFGNTTNNRVESQHNAVKQWIGTCTEAVDTLFLQIDAFIEGQLIEIYNSLEASRRKRGTEFEVPPYSALNGVCSHYCLELIQAELGRLALIDFDLDRCGCVVETTHGIPCGCSTFISLQAELLLYEQQVDHFWRTLVVTEGLDTAELLSEQEQDRQFFRSVIDEVEGKDPSVMRHFSRMMYSQLHPDQQPVEEPETNETSKGRGKLPRGMHRNKSKWEYDQDTYSRGRGKSKSSSGARKKSKTSSSGRGNSNNTASMADADWNFDMQSFPYFHKFPRCIQLQIEGWNDVLGDGNCGFRCFADAFCNSQDDWDIVRRAVIGELQHNGHLYDFVYGDVIPEAIARLRREGGRCRRGHYMETPADLFVLANHYRCTIFYFSMQSGDNSRTILPLDVGGLNVLPRREIAIAHLGTYQHYIRVQLKRGHPIPIIPPQWFERSSPAVHQWATHYAQRLALYEYD